MVAVSDPDRMLFKLTRRELTPFGQFKCEQGIPLVRGDVVETNTPYAVPNGKWVLEGYGTPGLGQCLLSNSSKIHCVVLDEGKNKLLWVSDEPFGLLRWDQSIESWLPSGGVHFESARQVHYGHKGRCVPIPKLSYVYADKASIKELVRGAYKGPGTVGWGKVSDLLEVIGLDFVQVVERFWPFLNPWHEPTDRFPVVLKMILDTSAEDIAALRRDVKSFTQQELLRILQDTPDAFQGSWIPEGFIKTILRLTSLGYMSLEECLIPQATP